MRTLLARCVGKRRGKSLPFGGAVSIFCAFGGKLCCLCCWNGARSMVLRVFHVVRHVDVRIFTICGKSCKWCCCLDSEGPQGRTKTEAGIWNADYLTEGIFASKFVLVRSRNHTQEASGIFVGRIYFVRAVSFDSCCHGNPRVPQGVSLPELSQPCPPIQSPFSVASPSKLHA